MIEKHIASLFQELDIRSSAEFNPHGIIKIPITGFDVQLSKKQNSFYLTSYLPLPQNQELEPLLIELMKANFLGQGTGKNIFGLSDDEMNITLSLYLSENIGFEELKENIEQILNYTNYWDDKMTEKSAQN